MTLVKKIFKQRIKQQLETDNMQSDGFMKGYVIRKLYATWQ